MRRGIAVISNPLRGRDITAPLGFCLCMIVIPIELGWPHF